MSRQVSRCSGQRPRSTRRRGTADSALDHGLLVPRRAVVEEARHRIRAFVRDRDDRPAVRRVVDQIDVGRVGRARAFIWAVPDGLVVQPPILVVYRTLAPEPTPMYTLAI